MIAETFGCWRKIDARDGGLCETLRSLSKLVGHGIEKDPRFVACNLGRQVMGKYAVQKVVFRRERDAEARRVRKKEASEPAIYDLRSIKKHE